jgi:uncharacterized protein involved in exopolysaccharide biosynthesis
VVWESLALLLSRWRFIIGVSFGIAVAAAGISLLIPNTYMASARVLRPEGGGAGLGMLRNVIPDAAVGLLGGGSGSYQRYLSILTSRSVMEAAVDEFDLVEVYETTNTEDPRGFAIRALREASDFVVALEYDYLEVVIVDRDPERAAAMANFFVVQLNERNAALSSEAARQSRSYIEQRVGEIEASLDSARTQLQAFQERYGLVELEQQAASALTAAAQLRAEAATLSIQYEALRGQYGSENPQVLAARRARDAAQRQLTSFLGGSDALLPVSLEDLPAVSREYAELLQQQILYGRLLEAAYPIYEQTLLQERRETESVQVLDAAEPPKRKFKPRRSLLVIGAGASAFLLLCLYVLGTAWLETNGAAVRARLRVPTREPAP